jgi:hypothetical protein
LRVDRFGKLRTCKTLNSLESVCDIEVIVEDHSRKLKSLTKRLLKLDTLIQQHIHERILRDVDL